MSNDATKAAEVDRDEVERQEKTDLGLLTVGFLLVVVAFAASALLFTKPTFALGYRTALFTAAGVFGYLALVFMAISNPKARRTFSSPIFRLGEMFSTAVGVEASVRSRTDIDARLEEAVEELRKATSSLRTPLSEAAEAKVVDAYLDALHNNLDRTVRSIFDDSVRREYRTDIKAFGVDKLAEAETSLRKASATVTARGFLNLIIGIGFAIAAFFFLRDSVNSIQQIDIADLTVQNVIVIVGIRLSLTILLTLIAYFFLTLYRTSLEDVRYYQNEITNLASRSSALALAIGTNKDELLLEIGSKLMSDDRNLNSDNVDQVSIGDNKLLRELVGKLPSISVK